MTSYLISVTHRFGRYKQHGEKCFAQLSDSDIHWQYNEASNSISVIVKHIAGNMLSRWTNFLYEDGEKEWRQRDNEFIDTYQSKDEMLLSWEKGWQCLFNAIESLNETHLESNILIRNEAHTVVDAINRQLSHYAYHIGQIVYVARMIKGKEWQSLSIPKGKSEDFNTDMFSKK